jgi:hypothetical protein
MKTYRVWEGRKGVRNNYKTFKFRGEDIGYWSDGHPVTHDYGTSYRIFRTGTNEIIIHRIRWSKWANEDDHGTVYRFASIEDAKEYGFDRILQNARVI